MPAFYEATGGANWGDNWVWLSEAEVGNWHGIHTERPNDGSDPSSGGTYRITPYTLYLVGNNLIGEMPPQLGRVGKLKLLDLNENQLSGPVPSELGDLSYLSYLGIGCRAIAF